jgi:hypothetical protein
MPGISRLQAGCARQTPSRPGLTLCPRPYSGRLISSSERSRLQHVALGTYSPQPGRSSCQRRVACQAADDEDAERIFLRPAADEQAPSKTNAAAEIAGSNRRTSWPPMLQQLFDAVLGSKQRALLCLAVAAIGVLLGATAAARRHQHFLVAEADARPQIAAVADSHSRQHHRQQRPHQGSYSWQDRALLLDASRAAHVRPPGSPVWISAAQRPGASEVLPQPTTQFASMSSPVGSHNVQARPYSCREKPDEAKHRQTMSRNSEVKRWGACRRCCRQRGTVSWGWATWRLLPLPFICSSSCKICLMLWHVTKHLCTLHHLCCSPDTLGAMTAVLCKHAGFRMCL